MNFAVIFYDSGVTLAKVGSSVAEYRWVISGNVYSTPKSSVKEYFRHRTVFTADLKEQWGSVENYITKGHTGSEGWRAHCVSGKEFKTVADMMMYANKKEIKFEDIIIVTSEDM